MTFLQWEQLACYRGRRLLFHGLSATFAAGEIVRIAGPNGIGKTTLLRAVAGLAPLAAGEIRFRGELVERQREQWQAVLLYLGHLLAAHELLTPRENLRFLVALIGGKPSDQQLDAALNVVGLSAQRRLPLKYLSAGQRRRVALARLFFAADRPIWLLDEPFTALDQGFVGTLVHLIEAHAAQGGLVLLTTHQEVPFSRPIRTIDLAALRQRQEQVA